MHTEEYLDFVTDQDEVIEAKSRREIYELGLKNFRVVNVFLKNSEGKLWIPRRTAQKKAFPSCLSMSMGGHVSAGESYEEAVAREMLEELRIDISEHSLTRVAKLTPHEHGTNAFMVVYELLTNEVPDYNRDDFSEYYWLTPAELRERIKSGDPCKGDIPPLLMWVYGE